ncbi:MAG: hypothetical protein MUF20_07460 [Methylotetracoccus sp.]|jgi:hypothetical protein|nr:hypothetical protein [Methylotetracoccus sp.]
MTVYLYLSLIPEALIASMLPPDEFGQYYATGHQCKTKGQAVFFDVDPDFRDPYFAIDEGIARCVPHPDGRPKHSVYISVYRVLEHIPVESLGLLHLSTSYGQTLALTPEQPVEEKEATRHLYQDLTPAGGLLVSTLDPVKYYRTVTSEPTKFIRYPALAFVELGLGALADDPEHGPLGDLPYPYIHHLREALLVLDPETKQTKLVQRAHTAEFPYRMVKTGFFVGNGTHLSYYRMPSPEVLRRDHARWWRLANL